MAKDNQFFTAKQSVLENLETLQISLVRSVDEGMIDPEDAYYNELLGLLQDAELADNWDDLSEAITRARSLEIDVAAWLARHGRTTVSLSWPKQPR
jgi:hypothetical protein